MLADWAVFAAAVWGLAFALNKTLFKDRPPSSLAKWSLTGILFIASFVLLGVVKHFRYQHLSEFMGFHIPMNNPFDSGGAFLMSFLFFRLLTKGKKAERAIGTTGTQTQLPRAPGSGDKASVSDHPSDSSLIDATYERIDQELQTGNLDRATWTRAQGDAEGDTERTKALYIKYRGQRLLEASRAEPSPQQTPRTAIAENPAKKGISRFVGAENTPVILVLVAAVAVIGFYVYKNNASTLPDFSGQGTLVPQSRGFIPYQPAQTEESRTSTKGRKSPPAPRETDWSQFTPISPTPPAVPVEIAKYESKEEIALQVKALERVYPDWRTIVGSKADTDNPYRQWLSTQAPAYQQELGATNSASVIAQSIATFKADEEWERKEAARIGISFQEFKRRSVKGMDICRTAPTWVDMSCLEDVRAGRR